MDSLIKRSCRTLWKAAILSACAVGTLAGLQAATYYVDPVTGNIGNPGTSAAPWSTLEAVFTANKTFVAGDVILLRSGYHGFPTVKGNNSGIVTIQPDTGATPKLKQLVVKTGTNWLISGLDICPENAGAGLYAPGKTMIDLQSTASYITVQNCTTRNVASIAGYTVANWQTNINKGGAISIASPHSTVVNNTFLNTGFGLVVQKSGVFALVSRNTLAEFYEDGFRALADDCVYEYNLVKDTYVADSNHDDMFQSWASDANGVVGNGVIYRNTVRGNMFLNHTDPNQPLQCDCQGISNFDGFSEGWVIENNVVSTRTYNGITFLGATNCTIVNNTVIEDPLDLPAGNTVRPWIHVEEHKAQADGSAWPVLSSGNIVRNNITSKGVDVPASVGVQDHNLTTYAYTTYFVNPAAFDFHLATGSPAIGTGSPTDAPTIDLEESPRTLPYDVGAYAFNVADPVVYEGFNYAATNAIGNSPDSPSDVGLLGTTWSGNNPVITPGLSYSTVPVLGNALQFNSNVGSYRNIDTSVFPAGYTQLDSDGVTRLGKAGTTLWIRFLMRADVADAGLVYGAGLSLNGNASGGITKATFGIVSGSANWAVSAQGGSASSATPVVVGDTVLVVARVQFIAGSHNDIVDLYINPPLASTPPAAPSVTLTGRDVGTFNTFMIKGGRKSTIDEITVATDWNDL